MAQVLVVKYENQADAKVFETPYESQADLAVLEVPYEQQATGDAVWHMVHYESQATFKIFKVKYEAQADLRIFKVKHLAPVGGGVAVLFLEMLAIIGTNIRKSNVITGLNEPSRYISDA